VSTGFSLPDDNSSRSSATMILAGLRISQVSIVPDELVSVLSRGRWTLHVSLLDCCRLEHGAGSGQSPTLKQEMRMIPPLQ